jgi:hypothetical protein
MSTQKKNDDTPKTKRTTRNQQVASSSFHRLAEKFFFKCGELSVSLKEVVYCGKTAILLIVCAVLM